MAHYFPFVVLAAVWIVLGVVILIIDAHVNGQAHSNAEAWLIVILYPFLLLGGLLAKLFRLGDAIADLAGLKRVKK